MAARSIGSGTISFGLVSIPVRLYVATHSEQPSFNMLHKKCGSRIRQQLWCPQDEEVVSRDEIVKGYQFAKDQYVTFTDDELKALEAEANRSIDIQEFVPLAKVDPIYFENAHYLGPDKGSEKAYHLLAKAMRDTRRVAVAQFTSRGKEHIALIRPYDDGLVMHLLHYADEVRPFSEVPQAGEPKVKANEVDLARKLVEQLATEDFKPEAFRDEYRTRLQGVVDRKIAGEEVTATAPEPARAQVIDLMDALKASLAGGRRSGRRPTEAAAPPGKRQPAAAARRRQTEAPKRRASKK